MSFRKVFTVAGLLTGAGFGLYTAYENFDPEHQSEAMLLTTRYFAECLNQGVQVAFDTGSFAAVGYGVGFLIEQIRECKFLTGHDGKTAEELETERNNRMPRPGA